MEHPLQRAMAALLSVEAGDAHEVELVDYH